MRYFTRPRGNLPLFVEPHWSDESLKPSLTVSDHEAVDTGLLDNRGDPIMRAPLPIGFGRNEEWS
jgi:hypothetical protein